jgi:hypothetical protein
MIVIEAHSDDAFLSLGGHIENWVKAGEPVLIVTVYSGTRKRAADAKAYADAVGAAWLGLGQVEAGVSKGGTVKPLPDALFKQVPFRRSYGEAIGPLGIQHPEHKEVWRSLDRMLPSPKLAYLDAPYCLKHKNHEEVNHALSGEKIESFLKPDMRKWRHIPLFRDQQFYFYRNGPEKLRECFELIVRLD